jgi:hypothetical protein
MLDRNRVSSGVKLSFPASPPQETRFLVSSLLRNRVSSGVKLSFPASPRQETRFLVSSLFGQKPGFFCSQAEFSRFPTTRNPVSCVFAFWPETGFLLESS